ncbi:MAG: Hpt domain-containing protein [Pseudodesulfovibrio sp.]|nr:Hpt domain-containing protein [Pseudodesulfovibrio sp.]
MVDGPIVEQIDPDLEELMERFFESSRKDLGKMQFALEAKDFTSLIRLGHTAKGTGYGYGFRGMGDIGLELENAAKAQSEDDVRAHIQRMAHYLDTVKVEFGK